MYFIHSTDVSYHLKEEFNEQQLEFLSTHPVLIVIYLTINLKLHIALVFHFLYIFKLSVRKKMSFLPA